MAPICAKSDPVPFHSCDVVAVVTVLDEGGRGVAFMEVDGSANGGARTNDTVRYPGRRKVTGKARHGRRLTSCLLVCLVGPLCGKFNDPCFSLPKVLYVIMHTVERWRESNRDREDGWAR